MLITDRPRSRFRSRMTGIRWSRIPVTMARMTWTVIFSCLLSMQVIQSTDPDVFQASGRTPGFNHLAVDNGTGVVYVGAINRIFQLDPSGLAVQHEHVTGPKWNNPECLYDRWLETCRAEALHQLTATMTDNVNKILVLDKDRSQVVACGSISQGTCEILGTSDVSTLIQSFLNDTDVSHYIAANNIESSTVAFIAPGPWGSSALYVGSTFSGTSTSPGVRDTSVPEVSTRKLQSDANMLRWKPAGVEITGLDNDAKYLLIDYVTGFGVDGFSYFLSVQRHNPKSTASKYVSKIIQVCQGDAGKEGEGYKSYVEINLECRSGGTLYNLVQAAYVVNPGSQLAKSLSGVSTSDSLLVATFSRSTGADQMDKDPRTESAVCLYSFKTQIRPKFTENIDRCFKGQQSKTGEIFGNKECVTFTPVTDAYCGAELSSLPLVGERPLQATILKLLSGDLVTSLAVDVVNKHTVAYLGTSTGHIKKMLLKATGTQNPYEDVTVDQGSAVSKDLVFDPTHSHLYVMTANLVMRLPLQDCGVAESCQACKELSSPYCGWCSLEKKCSVRGVCKNHVPGDKRWLSFEAWECIGISVVDPQQAQINQAVTITVGVTYLPESQQYRCVFGGQQETAATTSPNQVTCPTPRTNRITIPTGQDNVVTTVGIKSIDTGVTFVTDDFTFYDCGQHDRCSACTGTEGGWGCVWCVHSNICIDKNNRCTAGNVAQSNSHCPVLHAIPAGQELLVPVDYPTQITLHGDNLPEPNDRRTGYYCVVHLAAPPVKVRATRVSATEIRCDAHRYVYVTDVPVKTESIEVIFGKNYDIEDPNGISGTFFKCGVIASDCSRCIATWDTPAESKYNCTWCGNCQYDKSCSAQPDKTQLKCPKPNIEKVLPLTTPLSGGTLVTIEGSNLGRKLSDVNMVNVAGLRCDIQKSLYEVSKRIVCMTRRSDRARNGSVQVEIGTSVVPYKTNFFYQDPQVSSISPKKGPLVGGTRLTILGRNLLTGASIEISLGPTPCKLDRAASTGRQLVCDTEEADKPGENEVVVKFDGGTQRVVTGAEFLFGQNPNVTHIFPISTFKSGGRDITITGTNLDSVVAPKIYLAVGDRRTALGNCKSVNSGSMVCKAPPMNITTPTRTGRSLDHLDHQHQRAARETKAIESNIGLILDGIHWRKDINETDLYPLAPGKMLVYPDPYYKPFEGGKKTFKGEALTLEGRDLNLACTKQEVLVYVGKQLCKVDLLESERLLCSPTTQTNKKLHSVEVEVGNLKFSLGELSIEKAENEELWIIGVAVGGGVLITIIIIVVTVYKRRSADVERQNKKLQIQLDTLESNVRNECKQAFAELQTEVSDFTSDLNVIGIPFWDYKMYTFKVLFPSLKDHPILHPSFENNSNQFGGYEQGLQQFNQLLNSKQFLLIFIRTLEQQRNFSIRDKAVVASLMMIVLQDKMEYATDILKSLLNELIDRSVEKKHPKLMLRRTESVVEKLLTNWLSLSMYSHLKKTTGKMLFMLHKAIKHQTEKGPIDVFTSEAKYSLSEDRLLREKIEPKTLTVHLVTPDSKEPVVCKLLDCDTVTQAKEKCLDAIYLNTPMSRRPTVYEVDLEWRSGRSGHLPLKDEDVTTPVVNSWKRVNSLAHYHVPDGAVMAIVPARGRNEMVRQVHGKIEIGSSMSSLPPIVTLEEGTKVWHLVRHDDSQNVPRTQKVISEIFLTRLLATKGTLQQYIDDLFMMILKADSTLPPAVKYLFDFLDSAAKRHNITDPDVVHTWKSNSLPLRFWVNIIKNPEFVFDIHKSNIVDSCLSVIAQTFMDSCSTQEHRLGKDSPTNKLLFAKDIPRYRQWVSKFYKNVAELPPISDQDIIRVMTEMSMTNLTDFNVSVALKELYKYAMQYNFELLEALDEDPSAKRLHLANRFEQVQAIIEGTPLY